jgi:hypothetical protein
MEGRRSKSWKELIRWEKEGRRTHVFNPSSFALGMFSLGLLLTGTSDITWGPDIATTQFYPPHIYLMLFLVALPGQFLFGVTSMTMSAVVVTYLFGLAYFAVTGVYFFFDSYIPIAVFLGMHLLFNDPSTSPRTEQSAPPPPGAAVPWEGARACAHGRRSPARGDRPREPVDRG